MTLLEKIQELKPDINIFNDTDGDVFADGCPHVHGLETEAESLAFCAGHLCGECWAREYKEPAAPEESSTTEPADEPMRHFDTGAVRDDATGKGRYDLLPWGAIHALAQHCERGAIHYGERNVDKGIPQHSLIDSGVRHLSMYIQGDPEPYHLVAALWNIAWAVEQDLKRPHLVDLPERRKEGESE